jgi:hypothetical protein
VSERVSERETSLNVAPGRAGSQAGTLDVGWRRSEVDHVTRNRRYLHVT